MTNCRCGVGGWVIGQRCDLVNPVQGDAMEFMPTDRFAAEMHFAKACENLRDRSALLRPQASGAPSGVVRAALATAVGALDGAAAALDPDAADAARVACSFCGARVMRGLFNVTEPPPNPGFQRSGASVGALRLPLAPAAEAQYRWTARYERRQEAFTRRTGASTAVV
jgi:hypothetical protein